MTYALRIFFIIWYNYKQITIPPPGFGLLDTSGKRHLGDTIFGGTDMRISRQNKILELIETYEIETQDKLASLLRAFGYEVTQATISRDIKELHRINILSSTGKYKYCLLYTSKSTTIKSFQIRIIRCKEISQLLHKCITIFCIFRLQTNVFTYITIH